MRGLYQLISIRLRSVAALVVLLSAVALSHGARADAPTIEFLTPDKGPADGGQMVNIYGTGFGDVNPATGVTLDGVPLTSVNIVSPTEMNGITPAHSAGKVELSVTNSSSTATLVDAYSYLVAPTVGSLAPVRGPTTGGTEVTVTGTGFTDATSVDFGGSEASSLIVDSDTQIRATTTAHSAGAVTVTVTTPGGIDALSSAFTYVTPPTVTGLNPNSDYVSGGATVTISGTGFNAADFDTGGGTVKFGGTTAVITVDSTTMITATAPAHAAGTVDVVVTTGGGPSATGAASKFKYDALPSKTNIAVFKGGKKDGATPVGWLIADKAGNLYGATSLGGAKGFGTVFMLTAPETPSGAWTKTILHSFAGQPNEGTNPSSGLVADKKGRLYGVTLSGGKDDFGTVYRLTPPASGDQRAAAPWTYEQLYSLPFATTAPHSPINGIVLDKSGVVYFTTYTGGVKNSGAIFKVTPGSSLPWAGASIYEFPGPPKGGAFSRARLIIDQAGDVVGSTDLGGASNNGAVYSFTPPSGTAKAKPTLLYSLKGSDPTLDGAQATAGVIEGPAGVLFGTTEIGGLASSGVAFKLTPPVAPATKWTETVLWRWGFSGDGVHPNGLALGKNGTLYGTTQDGGLNNSGILFRLTPPTAGFTGWTERILYNFPSGTGGATPIGNVLMGKNNVIYGLTAEGGGACNCGTVFKVQE